MNESRVFQFGLKRPNPETEALVNEVMRKAQAYYNSCMELHRDSRRAFWALDNEEIRQAQVPITAAYDERRALRERINLLKCHKPAGDTTAWKAEIKALQQQGEALSKQAQALKKPVQDLRREHYKEPLVAVAIRESNTRAAARQKVLREAAVADGLHDGIYNFVERRASQSADKTKGRLPSFKGYTGEGTLAVQLKHSEAGGDRYQNQKWIFTKDAPVTRGVGPNPFIQVDPIDPRAWDETVPRGERKRLQRTKLRLRVGAEGRKPIWAEFSMTMHRPLPEGALVSNVSVTCEKVADRKVWKAQFTVTQPRAAVIPATDVQKSIAIDIGWRSLDGEIRVGYWADSDGQHGELRLPAAVRDRFAKAESLRGIRDQRLDDLRARLYTDLSDREALSPELRDEVVSLHNWRSASRFVRLYRKHKAELLPLLSDLGEAEEFRQEWREAEERARRLEQIGQRRPRSRVQWSNYFEAGIHRDRHLWQYEAGVRGHAIRCRNALYANWAADFVATYDLLVLEDLQFGKWAKEPEPEKATVVSDDLAAMTNCSRKQRVEAAPGRLQGILKNAAQRAGKLIVGVDARGTSKIHAACGGWNKLGVGRVFTCTHCGVTFDRDCNASQNILARGKALLSKPEALAEAYLVKDPKPCRFAKRHKRATLVEAEVV